MGALPRVAGGSDHAAAVQQARLAWLAQYAGRSPKTIATYDAALQRIWRHLPAPADWRLTPVEAARCLAAWQRDYAPKTVTHMLSVARQWWDVLQQAGLVPLNPWRSIKAPRAPKDTRAERILEPSEVKALFGATTDATRLLLWTLYYSGGRVSEVVALRPRDLHRHDGDRWSVTLYGKGGKTREVPLPPWLGAQLARVTTDAWVWPGLGRQGHLTANAAWKAVKVAAKRAGLHKSPSPHWFRHAHATHALAHGQSLPVVQAHLGHARLDTTEGYLHLSPGDLAATVLPAPLDLGKE